MSPLTTEELLDMFDRYNEAIWPLQLFAYGLGFLTVLLALRPGAPSSRLVAGPLAAFWLWISQVCFGIFNRGAWFAGLLLRRDHRAVGGGVLRQRAG